MDLATLGIRIDSNGVVKATGDLKGMEGQAKRSEDSIDGLSRAFRMLAPLVGTVMAAFSIRALTQYADAWSDMQSRVGAAVKNMEAAPALMERLVDVANASYSPLAQTVEIYGRNVAVLRDLGRGAVEAADFTEALNHALVTTATKGQDADVVLNALSRAISTGKLRAMEYETIMSRSPRVLEAVADAMGTTVTGLRQMAVDGKVTGGVIVDALIGSLEELREEAGEMPATIGDAFVRIQTNFGALVGRVDQATGASENFAITLIGLADSIRNMTDDVVRSAVVIQTIFGSALDGVTGLVASLGIEFDGMATLIIAGAGAAGFAVTTFGFITLRTLSAIGAALMMNPFALLIGGIAAAVAASYIFRDEIAQLIGFDVFGVFKDLANDIIGMMVGAYDAVVVAWKELPGEFESIGKLAWNALLEGLSGPAIQWTNPFTNEVHDILSFDFTDFKHDLSETESRAGDLAKAAYQARQGINYLGEAGQGIRDLWDNALGAQAALADLAGGGGGGSDPLGLGGAAGKLNAYQEATQAVRDNIAALEQQALTFGLSETAATRFNTAMDLLKAAQEAGIPITAGLIDEINGLADAYALAEERTRLLQQQQQLAIDINNTLAQGFSNMFTGIIDGSKNAGQAIGDLLKSLGQLLINNAFMMLFGGGTGGGIGGMFAGLFSFDGGGFTGYGPRSGGIDGRGGLPAILHPNETVIDHTLAANANRPVASTHTSGGDVYVTIERIEANSEAEGAAAARGFQAEMRRWQESGEGARYVRAVVNNPGRSNPRAA
ncbi:tape measure protein [Pelagibacterium sediminicola]|uniref:tape measure protein n=1 Tax=Pelagibacterium sediminicola TaxID=2248761 RepID=UPI000E322891|nr:tape measure protein [Pelagibacterium sediminicola]